MQDLTPYAKRGITFSAKRRMERVTLVVGEAAAGEGAHVAGDAEGLVVHADLVGHFLGVAREGGQVEGLLLGQGEEVLAHALVEPVLLGRRPLRVRDRRFCVENFTT